MTESTVVKFIPPLITKEEIKKTDYENLVTSSLGLRFFKIFDDPQESIFLRNGDCIQKFILRLDVDDDRDAVLDL